MTAVDEAVRLFARGVEAERVSQAMVVVGAPRAEAMEFAEGALGLLLCEGQKPGCGHCRACRQVAQHTQADTLWIESQKRSRQISIEQVRGLQSFVYQTSLGGGWKGCVICGADRMNASAANAFLKTLEEPPPQCLFLLLTDSPNALLPTILSRCQRVTVGGEAQELDAEWRKPLIDILKASGAVGLSGALARAGMLEGLLKQMQETTREETEAQADEAARDEPEETMEARAMARYREMRACLMREMVLWYRDVLLLVCGSGEEMIHFEDCVEALEHQAASLSVARALRRVRAVETMHEQMEKNLRESDVLSAGFAQLP